MTTTRVKVRTQWFKKVRITLWYYLLLNIFTATVWHFGYPGKSYASAFITSPNAPSPKSSSLIDSWLSSISHSSSYGSSNSSWKTNERRLRQWGNYKLTSYLSSVTASTRGDTGIKTATISKTSTVKRCLQNTETRNRRKNLYEISFSVHKSVTIWHHWHENAFMHEK